MVVGWNVSVVAAAVVVRTAVTVAEAVAEVVVGFLPMKRRNSEFAVGRQRCFGSCYWCYLD